MFKSKPQSKKTTLIIFLSCFILILIAKTLTRHQR